MAARRLHQPGPVRHGLRAELGVGNVCDRDDRFESEGVSQVECEPAGWVRWARRILTMFPQPAMEHQRPERLRDAS